MAFSFYDAYVPLIQRAVHSLGDILRKAEAHPNSKDLLQKRLAPDMYPLAKQIDFVGVFGLRAAADMAGEVFEEMQPVIDSFDAAYALLKQAEEALNQLDKDVVDKTFEKPISVYIRTMGDFPVLVKEKIIGWILPNLLFHVTVAYAILRMEGIPLGKADYIMQFMSPFVDFGIRN